MSGVQGREARPIPQMGAALVPVVGLGLGVGVLAALEPWAAAALCALLLFGAFLRLFWSRLPGLSLGLIGLCLIGYALFGRGFAYAGVPPLFIGEVALGLGILALVSLGWSRSAAQGEGRLQRQWPAVSGLLVLLTIYLVLGLTATLPYLGQYGLDSLRDAALWYYALFALITAALLLHFRAIAPALRLYTRFLPVFLVFAPVSLLVFRFAQGSIPKWPGSGVEILSPKGGDLAVHLAGALAFLMLGLHRVWSGNPAGQERREWLWWSLWLLGCLTVFTGRAALLTIAVAAFAAVLWRPLSRWGKPLYLGALLLALLVAFNVRVDVGVGREISAEGLWLNLQSVVGETGTASRDGTRTWRLQWWNEILDYTFRGPYFWTGKGYGINLADADGFQVTAERTLRSPHNGHMTVLARSGVPGLLSWAALQLAFAASLLLAHWRARAAQRQVQANLFLWIFVYWLAFMVNGAFVVFLEGPQGGIWFWCLFGFGLACLESERRETQ